MGPRDPRRTVQDDIREVLADPAARGDRLIEAIAAIGSRHSVEPFRLALGSTVSLERTEPQARDAIVAIDERRGLLESLLGRDPGFVVAGCDLLQESEPALRATVFRQEVERAPGRETPADGTVSLREAQRLETRRSERSGRPLAVVVLSPDPTETLAPEAFATALAALRGGARDADHVAGGPPLELIALLPCTGGREGQRAAERFLGTVGWTTVRVVRAEVPAAGGGAAAARVLEEGASSSFQQSRRDGTAVALHRAERRRHPRTSVGGTIAARLRRDGVESDVVVEDLSLGGALLGLERRPEPGTDIVLALRPPTARPAALVVPGRILRVSDGPSPGVAPWRAAVVFAPEARLRVAGILACLELPGGMDTA